ncbi:MAG: carboxylating nicotinate-nucleotide diphosphorylase [Holophagales bacterium]|nr:carboxylating nicotinate-nucleotide diphosphorylase [Holophagales bacterium]
MRPPRLFPVQYAELVRAALREDLGRAGDLTTDATLAGDERAAGAVVARRGGVVAGLEVAGACFRELDPAVAFETAVGDGDRVAAGATLARVAGDAAALLAAERTALNLLGRLCGIATATAAYVDAVAGTGARIVCTRKTTPGLRALEKYAVRCGGGANHRFGLDDAVLIKDNHLVVAGGVQPAIERARGRVGHLVKIEVEVGDLAELESAVDAGAEIVLLDNFSLADLSAAVARSGGRALLEASGGITLDTARRVAETGVDLLSVGALTHSSPGLDVALDLEI